MASSAPNKTSPGGWITDGMVLTVANVLSASGNYLFQAVMMRHLSWSEFGCLNATLSLIVFTAVPLTAASQTLTHHLAQVRALGDAEKIAQLQAASLKLLRRLTWLLFVVSAFLLPPVSEYLHFPRMSLAWAGLLWLPVNLWSTLGGAWCTGLSRFRLLSLLMILAAAVRLVTGTLAVSFYPWAESGISASIFAGLILASLAVFSPHHATAASLRRVLLQRDWLAYGAASLAVAFGAFVFLQGDQIIAQRHFPGEELGRYSGAGLLGRTIVWAGLPVLTVYFTRLEYDAFRASRKKWRDYVYGRYPELEPARLQPPLFDRMPPVAEYQLPERYALASPFGISQITVVHAGWFRQQCEALSPGPWYVLTDRRPGRRIEWGTPLHARSLDHLPGLIAGASVFVTINSAPNIIASGVRNSWHKVHEPGFHGQDNYEAPGQVILQQPRELERRSWRFWVHYWRRRLMGINTSRDAGS